MTAPTSQSDCDTPDRTRRRRSAFRDPHFLANRMASWLPDLTEGEIAEALSRLDEHQHSRIFKAVFKLNTTYNVRNSARLLAQQGWFFNMDLPPSAGVEPAIAFLDGKDEEAHSLLEQIFEARRTVIEADLHKTFPHRAKFIAKAFKFHDEADYDSSTPLFLIQADGICNEVFGADFFRIKGPTLAVSKKVLNKQVDWMWDAIIAPFRDTLPIAKHASAGSKVFNRHLILHGVSLEYGTRRNSLRAISLLAYLQSLKSYADDPNVPRTTDPNALILDENDPGPALREALLGSVAPGNATSAPNAE